MCLLGSIAKLRQFFLEIVIDQSIESNRPAESMLKIESQPKLVEPAKRFSQCWILVQRTDDLYLRQRCPSGVVS
jgi:hypothetical protein